MHLARAIAAVVALNLGLFVLVTSLSVFQTAHHHWIFPVLALLLALQWGLTFLPGEVASLRDRQALRATVLSALVFLLIMGIARHATILACFDKCSFKLGAAAAIGAAVFYAQRIANDPGFWNSLRSGLAALGALLWAVYLMLRGLQLAPWILDIGFVILALLFWLDRNRAISLIAAGAIIAGLAVRATANEFSIIGLSVVWSIALPLALIHRVDAWLKSRVVPERTVGVPVKRTLRMRILLSAARIVAIAAVTALLGGYVIGPTFLMTDPKERRARLLRLAPPVPIQNPKTLSPLAARLRGHVVFLAQTTGERDAFQRKNQELAREYIIGQLRASGYSPRRLDYRSQKMAAVKDGTEFSNVEARLPVAPVGETGAWIIGAHYDSAPGTPGADDNASGVAVMLETARLLKGRKLPREFRFAAFGTEEPPAFGTRNMGSYHYARHLKETGVKVHGMISLEMLGYYNPKPGSQLYPPFLHLFNPDHGAYVGAVSNVDSRRLLGAFKASWDAGSRFPLTTAILPGTFSSLALSDQLNFWDYGYPALMLSDTAFYRNPNYHQETDVPETLDYERMAAVTEALVRTLDSEQALRERREIDDARRLNDVSGSDPGDTL